MGGPEIVHAEIFAPTQLLLVLGLALLFFGGKKLPEVASSLGKAIREFKRATEEWQHPLEPERPPAPSPALPTTAARPVGRVAGIERAEELMGEVPETLEPGTRV